MRTYKVEVKYNSYLDDNEIGDLTCEMTDLFEFTEHAVKVNEVVIGQLKHDPQYRDVYEAKVSLFINGERIATQNYRRENGGVKAWRNSPSQIASVVEFV